MTRQPAVAVAAPGHYAPGDMAKGGDASFESMQRAMGATPILASVDAPQNVQERVLREGIYLANIHDGVFEIRVPDDFKPHAF